MRACISISEGRGGEKAIRACVGVERRPPGRGDIDLVR